MMLSNSKIAALLEDTEREQGDPLVITPLSISTESLKESVGASVDLRLGRWFSSKRAKHWPLLDVYSNNNSVEQIDQSDLSEMSFFPFSRSFILHPRHFVLGVTLEWVRMPKNLSATVTGRSSWGRRGLIVETAPGVYPGFNGCLTLEMTNVGEIPIAIRPGDTVCQLSFYQLDGNNSGATSGQFIGQRQPSLGMLKPGGIHAN